MHNNVRKRNVPAPAPAQQKNNNPNLLFYSKRCNTCVNLLSIMQNDKLLDYFRLICVDNTQIPPNIKIVPTLIVSNIAKPLVAKEIFDWINQIKYINKQKETDSQRPTDDQPAGFQLSEMSSISDFYAHTDIDEPMRQSYLSCENFNKAEPIITFPEHNAKFNRNMHKSKTDELINNRHEQESVLNKIIRENQERILREAHK